MYLETGFVLVVCYQLTSFHKIAGLIGGIGHFNVARHDIFVCKTLKKQQIVTCKNNMTHSFLKDKSSGYRQSWILELLHFTRHPWLEHFFRVLGGDGSANICVLLGVRCWRWGSHMMPKTQTHGALVLSSFSPLFWGPSISSVRSLNSLLQSLLQSHAGKQGCNNTGQQLSIQKTIIIFNKLHLQLMKLDILEENNKSLIFS